MLSSEHTDAVETEDAIEQLPTLALRCTATASVER
jgi:hypothetical protein